MKTLETVQSICPDCETVLQAAYVERDGKIYFEKTCPTHGNFSALVSNRAQDYLTWTAHPTINIPPKSPMTKGGKEDACPLRCGTCEDHKQTACCVLVDITNRCDQHCPYCFAVAEKAADETEPSLETLSAKFDLLMDLGEERPFNLQLSGGEPTVRDDLPQIIAMAKEKGFSYIQINTNGRRIAIEKTYAKTLKAAGASVIFLQFDGTEDRIYRTLRGEPLWDIKQQTIEHCRQANLPVTLVPTLVKNVNLSNIGEMMNFLLQNVDVVKGIHFQPVSFFGRHPDKTQENRVTMFDLLHEIENQCPGFSYGDFCPIATGHTLCCFYSTYRKNGDGVTCLLSEETKNAGVACCEQDPLDIIRKDRDFVLNKWEIAENTSADSLNSCAQTCCEKCDCNSQSTADGNRKHDRKKNDMEENRQKVTNEDTKIVSHKGDMKKNAAQNSDMQSDDTQPMDFDRILRYYRDNTFTVTGMAFQDKSNLDAERLKRCRVQVLSPDNRLIPFCGYNSIHRGK